MATPPTCMPILMFCIAFGLSMDYKVFLLSPDLDRLMGLMVDVQTTGLQGAG